ncbi:MAG: Prolyl oligopeptidase [Bacteroidota bacterium]|nr:Prolyl oligopeptidase [Bacteroidota bacterium]
MRYLIIALVVLCFSACNNPISTNYPVTKTEDSTDVLFGQTVKDPYRWLEHLEIKDVADWYKTQAKFTDSVLAKIPGQDKMKKELVDFDKIKGIKYSSIMKRGERYFFDKRLPDEEIGKIYYRDGAEGRDVLIFDPLTYEKDKVYEASYDISADGKIMALNLSEQGKEIGFMVFKDLANGTFSPERLLYSGGGFLDGSNDIVMYNKRKNDNVHDRSNALNTQFKMHKVGDTEEKDKDVFSRAKYPALNILPEDFPYILTSKNCNYIFGGKGNVNSNLEAFVASKDELEKTTINWKPFSVYADEVKNFVGHGDDIYFITSKGNNNNRLVKMTLPGNINSGKEIFTGGDWKIETIADAKDYLVITQTKNGVEFKTKKLEFATGKIEDIILPLNGTIAVSPLSNQTNECVIWNGSWIVPGNFYSCDLATGKFENGPFYYQYKYPGSENLVVEEVEVPAADSALVPLSIVYDKTKLMRDGSNIALLQGYGAYGISMNPYFNANELVLLEKGVVVAHAHVRGGGEKGEKWHLQGMKDTKPNTWKDFNKCAEYLISNKYTTAEKLGCTSASAGGILIGRAITERPDLYKVAIPKVGALNTTRSEFSPNGPVNTPEFGTIANEKEFKGLYEMDALQHVTPGVKYPAQLITTGFNDPRVSSWEPAKFAAAMQASSISGNPVLLYVNYKGGHFGGSTKSEQFDETAKIYAFLLWQCGYNGFGSK